MKIAYVTLYDSADVEQWSGLGSYILSSLERQGVGVIRVGPFKEYSDLRLLLKRACYKFVRGGGFRTDRDTTVLKALGRAVGSRLADLEIDAVFSPGTLPLSYLDTAKPIVFWTDATFGGLVDYYPGLGGLCPETVKSGNRAEQSVLSRCRAAIYSSQWAADTATTYYQVEPSKIHVVPFGANIDVERTESDIGSILSAKRPPCRLLFLGVDWKRKGGDLAVSLAETLNGHGIATELTIVGCVPPGTVPDFVNVVGFVSKSTPAGRHEINRFLLNSHFLILPTRADCAPVVVAEANSFGLPVLTSDIGGLPTLVRQGLNGFTFPLSSYVESAADKILHLMRDRSAYLELGETSFQEYKTHLNWDSAAKQVCKILSDVIGVP